MASIDGVDTPSGNLPLYFLLCHIIVLLPWQINSLSGRRGWAEQASQYGKKPSVLTSAAVHQAAVSPDNKAGQTEGRKEPRCREK